MTLERVALEQEEIIARQSAVISALLLELSQFRALDAEEQALAAEYEERRGDQCLK